MSADANPAPEDSLPSQDAPPPASSVAAPSLPPAFGEVVSRRPWYLVVLVFPFGVLLAVAPFLFHLQRNDLPRVLSAYDEACRSPDPGIRCVDRRHFLPRIEPLPLGSEGSESFRLILSPRAGLSGEPEGRWLLVRNGDVWQVRDDPPLP